ncbi:MAG: hypothetical protein ACJ79K_13480 [Gemmatimonadaceae bacterium]
MERRLMKSLAAIAAGAVLVGAIAACDNDGHTISGPQVTQYTLTSIDSEPLPHEINRSSDGTVITVLDDMILSVLEDKTWHALGHQTVTTNGVPATQLVRNGGTYVPGDQTTTFRDSTGNLVWVGSVSEHVDSLTAAGGKLWVFQR